MLWHKHGRLHGMRWVTGREGGREGGKRNVAVGGADADRPEGRATRVHHKTVTNKYQEILPRLGAQTSRSYHPVSLPPSLPSPNLSNHPSVCRFESEKDVPKAKDEEGSKQGAEAAAAVS